MAVLTPGVFTVGQSRADVEARLAKAGYQPGRTGSLSADQAFMVGSADGWSLSWNSIPCLTDYEVFVAFDAQDRLSHAFGRIRTPVCS